MNHTAQTKAMATCGDPVAWLALGDQYEEEADGAACPHASLWRRRGTWGLALAEALLGEPRMGAKQSILAV